MTVKGERPPISPATLPEMGVPAFPALSSLSKYLRRRLPHSPPKQRGPSRSLTMTPALQSLKAAEICRLAPVVPVLVIDDLAHAAPLAEALVAGGLPALEVTLRTPCALDAIRAMSQVPGGMVGRAHS